MNENKRFNMTEWLENKRNRTIALIIAIVLVAFALVVRLTGQIRDIGTESKMPDGGLLSEKGDYVERELPYYLTNSVSNPALNVFLALPSGAEVKDSYLVFEMNDVTYVIGDSAEALEELVENEFYKKVCVTVYGSKSDIKVTASKKGYIGSYEAEYCTSSADLQVSTREEEMYGIAYKVSLEDLSGVSNRSLVMYACSEDVEALNEAQVVLKEIVYSARKLDMSLVEKEEEEEITDRPVGVDYFYPIDVYWYDASEGYTNTIMLITWDNMFDKPEELNVIGPDGQIGRLNQDYTSAGHYVYEFGVTNGGEYYIQGGTDKQLVNATISVMGIEEYIDMYHYVEEHDGELPEHIQNRENAWDDEEEVE